MKRLSRLIALIVFTTLIPAPVSYTHLDVYKRQIERRLLTAGEYKGFLDPFSPQTPQQVQYAQSMLNQIHRQFIEAVRAGRGAVSYTHLSGMPSRVPVLPLRALF